MDWKGHMTSQKKNLYTIFDQKRVKFKIEMDKKASSENSNIHVMSIFFFGCSSDDDDNSKQGQMFHITYRIRQGSLYIIISLWPNWPNFKRYFWYFFTNYLTELQLIGKWKNELENGAGTMFSRVLSYETEPSIIICIWNFIEDNPRNW